MMPRIYPGYNGTVKSLMHDYYIYSETLKIIRQK